MMPYQGYQLFEAERPKSAAEQRAADARRGELAAAISATISAASGRMRAVVQRRTRNPSPPSRATVSGQTTKVPQPAPRRELSGRVSPMSSGREPSRFRKESVTR
jgi:hypothetical protein